MVRWRAASIQGAGCSPLHQAPRRGLDADVVPSTNLSAPRANAAAGNYAHCCARSQDSGMEQDGQQANQTNKCFDVSIIIYGCSAIEHIFTIEHLDSRPAGVYLAPIKKDGARIPRCELVVFQKSLMERKIRPEPRRYRYLLDRPIARITQPFFRLLKSDGSQQFSWPDTHGLERAVERAP